MKKNIILLSFLFAITTILFADLSDSLVAYYPFNGNANDESGNGNHGTIYGGANVENGYLEIGDNDSDRVSVPYTTVNGLGDFTFSALLKINNLHISGVAPANVWLSGSYSISTNDNAFDIQYVGNEDGWDIFINSICYSLDNSIMEDLNWHHIVILRIGLTSKLYIDGTFDNDVSVSDTLLTVAEGGLFIGQEQDILGGGFAANQSWAGYIDEFRIYKRALAEEEIQALYFSANFTSNITEGYAPLIVDFTDLSTGSPTSWQWDFQNDGIIDSYEQNPTFTYNDEGTYSVKLIVSDSVHIDSLIKINYINVENTPPAAPTNIQVNISGNDAIISWNEVDTTVVGTPIDVDYYIIYYSEIPYQDSLFFYLWFTPDTTFTHQGVAAFSDQMFYKVVSFVGSIRELNQYIEKYIIRQKNYENLQSN